MEGRSTLSGFLDKLGTFIPVDEFILGLGPPEKELKLNLVAAFLVSRNRLFTQHLPWLGQSYWLLLPPHPYCGHL